MNKGPLHARISVAKPSVYERNAAAVEAQARALAQLATTAKGIGGEIVLLVFAVALVALAILILAWRV